MHSVIAAAIHHAGIHIGSGTAFLFGVLIGFIGCFAIEHRK